MSNHAQEYADSLAKGIEAWDALADIADTYDGDPEGVLDAMKRRLQADPSNEAWKYQLELAQELDLFEDECSKFEVLAMWGQDVLDAWCDVRIRHDSTEPEYRSVTYLLAFGGPNATVTRLLDDTHGRLVIDVQWWDNSGRAIVYCPNIAGELESFVASIEGVRL